MLLNRLAREPLLHFFVVGAALFALYNALNPDAMRSEQEIVVGRARVASLSSQFERLWQRPPTDAELKGVIDSWVREEILYREGLAMGLEQDDQVVRRRIAQKMMFFADGMTPDEAGDEQLRNWLDNNAERYRLPAVYTLQQVYFDAQRPAEELQSAVANALAELQSGNRAAAEVGDSILLPGTLDYATDTEIARIFGVDFATALETLAVGEWTGPVRSGYGLHLVKLNSHEPGRAAELADVRAAVERDFLNNQSEKLNEAFYSALKSRYSIQVEAAK
jgi:hypothetical protein